jgi:membrane protein DedA with SNARE-associated domain
MTTLDQHLAAARPLLEHWGYAAVFLSIFVEGVGIPAPGQTMLVAGAVLAGRGELALAPILISAVAAATAGNVVGWAIGRYGGRPLLERLARGERLARIERLFQRSSAGIVAFGRFIDGVRQLNGLAAGALGMPPRAFHSWNVVGALLWCAFWGLGGYALGRDFAVIVTAYHRLRPYLLWSVLAGSVLVLVWLLRGAHRASAKGRGR